VAVKPCVGWRCSIEARPHTSRRCSHRHSLVMRLLRQRNDCCGLGDGLRDLSGSSTTFVKVSGVSSMASAELAGGFTTS
jgi:hypothetical protein